MRCLQIPAGVCFVLGVLASTALHAQTSAPPACRGRDVLVELQTSDSAGFAAIRAAADATVNARALLWRIERSGIPASFLFGTVHSTDERLHKLSPAVQSALDNARTVALELADLATGKTSEAMMRIKGFPAMMTYQSGNGLADHLSEAELSKLRTVLGKSGIPANVAHLIRPWFAWTALALPECEARRVAAGLTVLDQRIGEAARKGGKRVIGLETVDSQVKAIVGMPEETQVQSLRASLALIDRQDDLFELLLRLYLARDLGVIWPLNVRLFEKAGFDPAVLAPLERNLIDKRNIIMRDAALPLLQEGGVFIAVGALHLPGKSGLVELLRAAGYTVNGVE